MTIPSWLVAYLTTLALTSKVADSWEPSAPSSSRRVVVFDSPPDLDALDLLSRHGVVEVTSGPYVQVRVGDRGLSAIRLIERVVMVRAPFHPSTFAFSEGVAPMGALPWHLAGWDGRGVRIGVLDVGFLGYTDHASDLPVVEPSNRSWSESAGGPGATPHGTACAEIIYDIAPGAEYYYATISTEVEFLAKLDWLASKHVHVISSSVGFNNVAPLDGSGAMARKVDELYDRGILYVTAAGNEGQQYTTTTWTDKNGDSRHDFLLDWPDTLAFLVNESDAKSRAFELAGTLRWFEDWGAAAVNFDLRVLKVAIDDPTHVVQVVGASSNEQDGDDDPVEELLGTVFGVLPGQAIVVEVRWSGGASPEGMRFRLWVDTSLWMSLPEPYRVPDGSLATPADARHAIAVGAVHHETFDAPAYNSRGPTDDGRVKPDLYGLSHVSTESLGAFDPTTQRGFSGTSAAAPHVAGIAALLWSIAPETLNAADVRMTLMSLASPDAIRSGQTSGAGLVALGDPPEPEGVTEYGAEPAELHRVGTTHDGCDAAAKIEEGTGAASIKGCVISALVLVGLALSRRRQRPLPRASQAKPQD